MAAGDGGIYSFGTAPFYGSATALGATSPAVDMAAVPQGGGYWLTTAAGAVTTFGTAPWFGSAAGLDLKGPIVGMAVAQTPTPDTSQSFTIAGALEGPLLPGRSHRINVQITNPTSSPITITNLTTTLATSSRSCDPSNFIVAQGFTRPVTVGADTTATLSSLGVDRSDWPEVTMRDTATNQDGCKQVVLEFVYQGVAAR